MRAISAFIFECGISTSSCPAERPLRMRVRKSAIGSFIALPARLPDARDQSLACDLAKADPAEAELAVVRARATAALAAVVHPSLVLVRAALLDDFACFGQS